MSDVDIIDLEELQRRAHAEAPHVDDEKPQDYRYVKPFATAADGLIEVFQNTEGRYLIGLREVDLMMRGVGRGELCVITGFAHSGKTQVFLTSLLANRDKPVLFFTLDETAELILTKLACMTLGVSADLMEQQVKAGNEDIIRAVRRIATEEFANLLVVDQGLDLDQMTTALHEAEHYFGEPIAAVGIDFLDLLAVPNEEGVEKKAQSLKRWTKDADVPVICLHQNSRSNGAPGEELTMLSMKYGGEAEANFVVGVRRKRDSEKLDSFDRAAQENTVSVSVVKNKRPPSKKGEADYWLDPATGVVRTIREDDGLHLPRLAGENTRAAIAAVGGQEHGPGAD